MTDKYTAARTLMAHTEETVNSKKWIRTGLVTDVRKKDRKIRVKFLPENRSKSQWIRVYMLNSGPSYVSGFLPAVDSEVVLLFLEGSPDGAIVLSGGFVYDNDTAPDQVGDNEWNIMDSIGNLIKLTSAGIQITSASPIKLNAPQIVLNDGVLPVARQTDIVQTPMGPGTISGGCATVLA